MGKREMETDGGLRRGAGTDHKATRRLVSEGGTRGWRTVSAVGGREGGK